MEEQLQEVEKNPKERDPQITPDFPPRRNWKRLLNYQSVVKQVPFFLFLSVLAVVYIFNGHHADKTIRKINRTSKEVRELQYEYIAVKSKLLYQSKQGELTKAVEPLGLKELVQTPVTLNKPVEEN